MMMRSWRTVLLVVLSVALGAAVCSQFGPRSAQAEGKLFKFIKSDQMRNAKTVAVNNNGTRFVYITNLTGMKANLSMSEDIGEQAEAAFASLKCELTAAGLKRTDVIKLTIYVKNLDLVEGGYILRAAQIYFDHQASPLITWVGVTSLVLPNALVEIEALAVARD